MVADVQRKLVGGRAGAVECGIRLLAGCLPSCFLHAGQWAGRLGADCSVACLCLPPEGPPGPSTLPLQVFDDEVVVCKMNPVNEYLGPHVR